jgi:uncharacterized protein (TIGR02186 family)
MRVLLAFIAALLISSAASAQNMTVDLAERQVAITTGFNGSHLTLFGTKRAPGDIAVVVSGPDRKMVVRRKGRVAGIWMNATSMTFWRVPSFYDVAVSGGQPDEEILRAAGIGIGAIDFKPDQDEDANRVEHFKEALIRTRQEEGLFPVGTRKVNFKGSDLFRADFNVPADVPTGDYKVTAYLLRDGRIVGSQEDKLHIGQAGLAARLSKFSRRESFAYGLVCVLFAIFAGATAHALMQRD